MTRRDRLDTLACAVMLGVCLTWGCTQVLAKVANAGISPLLQAGLRSTGAALLVWAWTAARGIRLFDRAGSLVPGLVAGLLFAGEFALIFWGLEFTTASRTVIFVYSSPFRGRAWRPSVRAGREAAGDPGRRPGRRLCRRGSGLLRRPVLADQSPADRRQHGIGGRRAVGRDHGAGKGDPPCPDRAGQDALLSARRIRGVSAGGGLGAPRAGDLRADTPGGRLPALPDNRRPRRF